MKHINIDIYGNVQGVMFRYSAWQQARKLRLTGFARNAEDGSVHIEAEGNEKSLNEFIKWCHKGPAMAHVNKVETSESRLLHFNSFEIKK